MPNEIPSLIFDHLGLVVMDIGTGTVGLENLLGTLSWTKQVDDARLGVSVRFARDTSGIVYELVAPYGDTSPVAHALKSKTNLLNHIAYRTHSLEVSAAQLRSQHTLPVGAPVPALAFGGARVQFFMTTLGFLLELIEIDHAVHEYG